MSCFRDPTSGRWLTQALFPETATKDTYLKYRLKDGVGEKYKHLPVLKDLYMDMMDPTEYRFANKHLGGWEHWLRLCENAMISREIVKWREELEVKMVAMGLLQVTEIANDPDHKGRLSAARLLMEKGWKPKETGRPTKAAKKANEKFDTRVADEVSADLERMRNLQ